MTEGVDEAMRDYYDRRASEYDDYWLGTGRFADLDRPGWSEEVDELIAVLDDLPSGHLIDIGCGTAFLTRHLPGAIVALDQSPSMVAIARGRVPNARVLL